MKKRGSVTVFITLLMTVIAAFILTLVSYVSGISDKLEAEYAADNAIRSCFAEYNRELYKRFHIILYYINIIIIIVKRKDDQLFTGLARYELRYE